VTAPRILDTNIISLALRGDAAVVRHLGAARRRELAVTAISLAELEYGSRRSKDPEAHRTLWLRLIKGMPVLSFTRSEAYEHARLRETLREQPIGERDLIIAAIAMANGFGVITRNAREFKRVRGLKVVEWAG